MAILFARSACFTPNFLRQNFSCCGGLSLRTTAPAIHVSSLLPLAMPLSELDKRERRFRWVIKRLLGGCLQPVSVNNNAAGDELELLNSRVVACKKCPRLAKYIRKVGSEKVKRFSGETY